MAKRYVGQIVLLRLDTQIVDLSGAADPFIRAHAPDGSVKDWPAEISGTFLTYLTEKATDETPGDLHIHGEWGFQPHPNIPGAEAPGETAYDFIYPLGG